MVYLIVTRRTENTICHEEEEARTKLHHSCNLLSCCENEACGPIVAEGSYESAFFPPPIAYEESIVCRHCRFGRLPTGAPTVGDYSLVLIELGVHHEKYLFKIILPARWCMDFGGAQYQVVRFL